MDRGVWWATVQLSSVQSLSHANSLLDCRTPGFPIHHQHLELAQTCDAKLESVMPSNHLILCHPFLLLPSIFPSIRLFSNEPAFHIRWPKYWTFGISPSNESVLLIMWPNLLCKTVLKSSESHEALSEVKSLSRVQLFGTPWTVAYQAPPSMGFSRQEYWRTS